MAFIRDYGVFHRLLRDSIETSVHSHTATMANGAAMTAAMQVVHRKSSPYIQGSRTFRSLSLPKSYLEEFKDFKEMLEAFLRKYHSLGTTYGEMAKEFNATGTKFHQLGDKAVDTVRALSVGILGIVIIGGLSYSGCKLFQWWRNRQSTPDSLESNEYLVEYFIRKSDLTSAYNHLYLMIDEGHVPGRMVFESLMKALLVQNRVLTANRVLKLMHTNVIIGENFEVVSAVLASLLSSGKMGTALKRMDLMIDNGEQPKFNRIMDLFLASEKRPSTGMCVKFFDYLVSKEEVLAAYRLVNSDLITGGINYQEFGGILSKKGYEVEAQIVYNKQAA